MKKVIIGAVVGGAILFVWQFSAWMFLGIHKLDNEPLLGNEAEVAKTLEGTARGVYWIPGMTDADMKDPDSAGHKSWDGRYRKGPRAFIVYDPEGAEPMQAMTMVAGAVFSIVTAFIAALMLHAAGIRSFLGRVVFVAGFGVLMAAAVDLQNWNWSNYPVDWTVGWVIDHIGGMAVAGIPLSLIVKPSSQSSS